MKLYAEHTFKMHHFHVKKIFKKFLGRGQGKRRLTRDPAAFLNHFKHCRYAMRSCTEYCDDRLPEVYGHFGPKTSSFLSKVINERSGLKTGPAQWPNYRPGRA